MIIKKIHFLLFSGMILSSCTKDSSTTGGKVKGTISLEAHAVHHSRDVSNIAIYLERNTTEFPGYDSTVYDLKGITDGNGKFTFTELFPGNYYVYASGFDSEFGANVRGYMPVALDNSINNNFKSLTLTVSE